MKRLCLFAGYSHENKISEYVIYYLKKISKFCDVYYLDANYVEENELSKLDSIVCGRWAEIHKEYDFGSWKKLISRIGWSEIYNYKTLVFANDSNYGPLYEMDEIFQYMDSFGLDAWGITENFGISHHLQSYFLVFNKKVIINNEFRNFIESITEEKSKIDIVIKYEVGISNFLIKNNFSFMPFVDRLSMSIPIGLDISRFQNTIIKNGSPFLKRKVFSNIEFPYEDLTETLMILNSLEYPIELVDFSFK